MTKNKSKIALALLTTSMSLLTGSVVGATKNIGQQVEELPMGVIDIPLGNVAYNSCQAAYAANGNQDGTYTINLGSGEFSAYCMKSQTSSYIWTFKYFSSGITTRYVTDNNSCKGHGLNLFAPISREDMEDAKTYMSSQVQVVSDAYPIGPLGVYKPTSGANSRYRPLNSEFMGMDGWKSIVGSKWWVSDLSTVSEPNGDYTGNGWLWYVYDGAGNVSWWNDGGAAPHSKYLCSVLNTPEVGDDLVPLGDETFDTGPVPAHVNSVSFNGRFNVDVSRYHGNSLQYDVYVTYNGKRLLINRTSIWDQHYSTIIQIDEDNLLIAYKSQNHTATNPVGYDIRAQKITWNESTEEFELSGYELVINTANYLSNSEHPRLKMSGNELEVYYYATYNSAGGPTGWVKRTYSTNKPHYKNTVYSTQFNNEINPASGNPAFWFDDKAGFSGSYLGYKYDVAQLNGLSAEARQKMGSHLLRGFSNNHFKFTMKNLPAHDYVDLDFVFADIDSSDSESYEVYVRELDANDNVISNRRVFSRKFYQGGHFNSAYPVPMNTDFPYNIKDNLNQLAWGQVNGRHGNDAVWDMSDEPMFNWIPHTAPGIEVEFRTLYDQHESDESTAIGNFKLSLVVEGEEVPAPDVEITTQPLTIQERGTFDIAVTSTVGDSFKLFLNTDEVATSSDGNFTDIAAPSVDSDTSLTYTVKAYANEQEAEDTLEVNVTAIRPQASVVANNGQLTSGESVNELSTVSFDAAGSTGDTALTYEWTLPAGMQLTSGALTDASLQAQITDSASGTLEVSVQVSDGGGLADTATFYIQVVNTFDGFYLPQENGNYYSGYDFYVGFQSAMATGTNATPGTPIVNGGESPSLLIMKCDDDTCSSGVTFDPAPQYSWNTGASFNNWMGTYLYWLDTSQFETARYRFLVDLKDGSEVRAIEVNFNGYTAPNPGDID